MVIKFPFFAPTSPPETGASIEYIPCYLADLYIYLAKEGLLVVWSIKIEPFFISFKIPSLSKSI